MYWCDSLSAALLIITVAIIKIFHRQPHKTFNNQKKKTSDSAANKRVIIIHSIQVGWVCALQQIDYMIACLAGCQGVKSLMGHSWIYQLPAEHHNHHHHPWEPRRLLMPQLVC